MRSPLAGVVLGITMVCGGSGALAGSPSPARPVEVTGAPAASPVVPALLSWQVVGSIPHDTGAWTEGLLIDDQGRLFESTGIVGATSVREIDRTTGEVLRTAAPPGDEYGEGLAQVGDRLLQLTWADGVALEWDADTLELTGSHRYTGEGWGLCGDGERLLMTDGSSTLWSRDPATFTITGSVEVTLQGQPVPKVNELECVDGEVWSNVWETPYILRIDPASGTVTGVMDMRELLTHDPAIGSLMGWLNGIAWDPVRRTFQVTGKYWPTMFEVRVAERP